MDFFERQEKAHRNTKLLAVYFAIGVALLVAGIYAAVMLVFTGVSAHHHSYYGDQGLSFAIWNPKLFLAVLAGTLAVIAIGSISKTAELSQGGSAVAEMLGGRLLNSSTDDPDERKLLNVVEEMALASGVPVPQVYVLDSEQGINAFAAGHSTSDAVVTVTRGCMKLLTRDELQGVIGHEFSHILNGDMRLNIRLMGIIFGILCLAVVGRILMNIRGERKNPLPLLGLLVVLSFSRRSGPVRELPPPARATPIEFLEALGSLYRNAGAASTAVGVAWERFRRQALKLCGLRGQPMAAAELAAVIRRRFPGADESLEADLAACEEAAWGETVTPRQALKLIQTLDPHRKQFVTAARPGGAAKAGGAARAEDIHSRKQERAS